MSIKFRNKIILEVNKYEYDFLLFVRNKMPFGKCVLITRDGYPLRIERPTESIMFGVGQKREEPKL